MQPNDEHEQIPPPDCPPDPHNRDGLLFRNVYSVDQKDFGWYKNDKSDIALVAPPVNTTNGPLTIIPDPDNPSVTAFRLISMKAYCRYYENAEEFLGGSNPINCTITVSCEGGKPRRSQDYYKQDFEPLDHHLKWWAVAELDPIEFNANWGDLAKCELSVDIVEGSYYELDGSRAAIMIDDLAVDVTTC